MGKAFRILLPLLAILLLSQEPVFAQRGRKARLKAMPTVEELLKRNEPGQKSYDFRFITSEGDTASLHRVETDLTVVFLYHPDCYPCIATIPVLNKDEHFRNLLDSSKMTVLAVDLSEDMLSITEGMGIPKGWTLCFDYEGDILKKHNFYTTEFPGIYLLDKEKTVLLKNPSAVRLLSYLKEEYPL